MRIRELWVVTFLFCLATSSNFSLAALQSGSDGQHGNDGSPGRDGGHGGNAMKRILESDSFGKPFYWLGTGFHGGNGGNGGNGWIPNAGPEDSAAGGHGGNGGRGGDVETIWSALVHGEYYQREVHVEAVGGQGGAGGIGGLAFQNGPYGLGGFGGHGGSAHAVARAGFWSNARAVGGLGGTASGIGVRGGNGGSASAAVMLVNPENHVEFATFAPVGNMMVVGGGGGQGLNLANGGHGGHALIGGDINNFNLQSNEVHFWAMRVVGRGGDGGMSEGGNGGRGGHVFADLSSLQDSSRYSSDAHQGTYTLTGGNGGHSLAHPQFGGHGGEGGSVLVQNSHFPSTSHTIDIRAQGGHGGDALDNFGGHGGRGGAIVFEPMLLGSFIDPDLQLRGGNGGHSQSGNGGDGRTVVVHNPLISDYYIGSYEFNMSVRGGNGGNLLGTSSIVGGSLRRAGDGGHARLTSINAFPNMSDAVYNAHAIGGWAGQGLGSSGPERAGDAYVEVRQSTTNRNELHTIAEGGRSHQRTNGNAYAISDLTIGAGSVAGANGLATATARPLHYFNNSQPYPVAAVGGNAYAEAKITRKSGSHSTDAIATAEGGFGTIRSGWSKAVATSINETDFFSPTPNPDSTAIATAISRADGSSSSANNAMSNSLAVGYFKADSQAMARAEGQYNYGHAVAEFQALRGLGRAAAHAQGETTQWAHRSNVSATATALNHYSTDLLGLDASAYTSFRQTFLPEPVEHSAWNHVLINPRRPAVEDFTISSSLIDSNFDFGTMSNHVGNVVALGQMGGGGLSIGSDEGDYQVLNQFDLTIHLFPGVQDSQDLSLAFFNPISTGNGFDSLAVTFDYEGTRVLDVDFSDLASAQAFFRDRIIGLDDLVNATGTERSFDLRFELQFSNADDSFGFDFLLGGQNAGQSQFARSSSFSTVPEPATLPMLLGLASFFLIRRRRAGQTF